MTKTPGMSFNLEETELDLTYKSRYKDAVLPEVRPTFLLSTDTDLHGTMRIQTVLKGLEKWNKLNKYDIKIYLHVPAFIVMILDIVNST